MQTQHVPVMLEEVLHYLHPQPGGHYIDGTLGGGGHTQAILEHCAPDGRVLGIDTDNQALERVRARFQVEVSSGRLVLAHGNFADLARIVGEAGFTSVRGVLLDLGFSSDQMDNAGRGFSFSADGPLDMRLDQGQERTAADIVNDASEQELADIFWRYGEETRSRQIARRIVRQRAMGAIIGTKQLAQIAAAGVPYKTGAIHPATKVFQALRIAVNHELEQLETVLPQIVDVLQAGSLNDGDNIDNTVDMVNMQEQKASRMGGRMVIIAFHSLEDRMVKEFIKREATDCICPPHIPVCVCGHTARLRILTRKPVTPTPQEIITNPRARSAKLRAAEIIVSS
ncbi:MAG TPA: 16S rRNA (cytosine(1402)-N(4))-methyltransferase RsmH [Ktedonobacteraceae bacterium]|nr:16S rRNA (cytosine(1402)-N(4))-methyltransferase RsmH [Ktedonobacteraceae bacterium]